jgi:hypothetical protein
MSQILPIQLPLYMFGGIFAFFILREVVTWYWKVNRVVELLEQIEENTRPGGLKREKQESFLHGIAHLSEVGDE